MNRRPDPVAISNGNLAAQIDPFGAELLSLKDSRGREYMTDADPAFWTGHAPLLFPIVGRLNGDVLRVDGREYSMRQHGFARRMAWEIVEQDLDAVRFRLSDTPETRQQYPFAFDLTVRYGLAGNRLSIVACVRNPGDRPLPFSFGFHPAFAWPLPGGGDKGEHQIIFDEAEPQDVRRLDKDGMLAIREQTPIDGRSLSLTPGLFEADALIWDELKSRRVTYRSVDGPSLEIHFNLPHLGIWQKPGANFICIEPWAGLADMPGFAGEFTEKCWLNVLEPGDEAEFAMDVTIHEGQTDRGEARSI